MESGPTHITYKQSLFIEKNWVVIRPYGGVSIRLDSRDNISKQTIHIGIAYKCICTVPKNSISIYWIYVFEQGKVTPKKNCKSSTIFADLSQPTDKNFRYFTTPEQAVK